MMKPVAPGGATATFCTFVAIFSFPAHSIKGVYATSRPTSHVLITSTAATPNTRRPELPVRTTATPVADMAATIIASATAGIESAIEEEAGETESFVHSFVVQSDITFRYSRTQITSAVVNPHRNQSHEVSFNVTLPQNAFITEFSMTVDETVYDAYVHDRESAAKTYAQEKHKGKSAGLAQAENTHNAQWFTIHANVRAASAVIFTLAYEELLERKHGHFEQVIHIESEEVRNSGIIVTIVDANNITTLKAVGRQNRGNNDEPMTGVGIEVDGTNGILAWAPNVTSNVTERKIPEQFVVQCDVEHQPGAGQIILWDGYFVHFYIPLAPAYPKHVIFVLDISGSMCGTRIRQLREAMANILDDLLKNHQRDYFSIITFNHGVYIWNGGGSSGCVYPVTTGNIDKAKMFTSSLQAQGGTNIRDALNTALGVAADEPKLQRADPIIMFLSDGHGDRNASEICAYITNLNKHQGTPIYSLAFGRGADYRSLKYLSLLNKGTARIIYEEADAALQLENFYHEISSSIPHELTFSYTSDQYSVADVTRRKFSKLFTGNELVVAGKLRPLRGYNPVGQQHWSYDASQSVVNQTAPTPVLSVHVSGQSGSETKVFNQPDVIINDAPFAQSLFNDDEDDYFTERLWAYLRVKQLLEDAQAETDFQAATGGTTTLTYPQGEDPTILARDIAVEYNFVTPLTSLVVVMPNAGEAHIDQSDATAGTENAVEEEASETEPFVDSFFVYSDIKFRYSRTQITSTIVNPHHSRSQEASFNVTLPEKAFIFKFSMTVDGQVTDAYVDDRESAAKTYGQQKGRGKSAGLVQTENTRNAQRFTILANVKASSAVIFTLTYEELLERKYGHYEQVIHIESEKARTSGIIASIADTKNITMLKAAPSQNRDQYEEPMTGVDIELDGAYGILAWVSNATLNETERKIPERFVVQYEVEHHPGAGEILVRNGYFVHFFAPQTPAYPKHVIFVLDISGSMWGNKIRQLREAIARILDDLLYNHQRDYFTIITFSDDVFVWNDGGSSGGVYPVTTGNIGKARVFTNSLQAGGGMNIRDALARGLNLAAIGPREQKADPMIMFLSDGHGDRNAAETRAYITDLNKRQGVPIYSLAFGKDADYPTLKYLSLLNHGTARKIYKNADAALQVENFYAEISSPILNGVNFSYTSDLYNVSPVRRRKFSRLFKGTELVVVGNIVPLEESKADPKHCSYHTSQTADNQTYPTPVLSAQVSGQSGSGAGTTVFNQRDVNANDNPISQFTFPNTTSLFNDEEDDDFMERLWVHLTVTQLLQDAQDDSEVKGGGSAVVIYPAGEDPNVRAHDLAMEYKFVTPFTSLVV